MGKLIDINLFGQLKATKLTDTDLIKRYQDKQDPELVGVILNRYSTQIMAMGYKYLKNEEDARDLASDLYVKLVSKLKDIDIEHIRNFKAWLTTVVKNSIYDQLRKRQTRAGHYESYGLMAERSERPEVKQIKKMDEKHLHQAIDQLAENERECLKMIFFEEKSYPEIMALTGWSFNQARGYRDRSIKKLKGILGASFKDYLKDF